MCLLFLLQAVGGFCKSTIVLSPKQYIKQRIYYFSINVYVLCFSSLLLEQSKDQRHPDKI